MRIQKSFVKLSQSVLVYGVLQHGQRYIYEFLWKTSLSSKGETNMHLTNTFKDELTSSLKHYSSMNSLQIAKCLMHLHIIQFMWLYTIRFFHNRYFNKQ